MATTRKDLRQRLMGAGFCNDGILSTATGGTVGTLLDTKLKQPDSAFNYGQIVALTGNAAGDRRYVTAWTQSSGTFTVDRNFTGAPANSDSYEIHRIWSADEKDREINEAIKAAALRWARRIEDTSLSLASNTFTYSLASLTVPVDAGVGIDHLEYDAGISGTGAPYAEFEDDYWRLRNNDGVLTLQLYALPRDSGTLRLTYRVRPPELSADSDTLKPDLLNFQNFICAKAAAFLFDKQALRAEQDAKEHWQTEAQKMHQLAEAYYGEDKPQAQPSRVIFGIWGHENDKYASPIRYGEN